MLSDLLAQIKSAPISESVNNSVIAGNYGQIIGVCFIIISTLVGIIWKASALTNDLKALNSEVIILRADGVDLRNKLGNIDQVSVARLNTVESRTNILENNYNHVVSDVHDMKQLIEKIYDKVSKWDGKN